MAWIRRKPVKEYEYFQVVHNFYEDGKVRQKVLCHLGRHSSIEAAIKHEKRQEAFERKNAAHWKTEAEEWSEYLHTPPVTPTLSKEKARQKYQNLERKRQKLARDHRYGLLSRKEADAIWEKLKPEYDSSGALWHHYYDFIDKARAHEKQADRAQAKLNKLLAIQQEYF